jgi:hypothetical protein
MDKVTFFLMFAHNGLNTAAVLLNQKAAGEEAKAAAETDPKAKAALLKSATKDRNLAKILNAADVGIQSYVVG